MQMKSHDMKEGKKGIIVRKSTEKKIKETIIAILSYKTLREAAASLGISERGLYKRINKYELHKELNKVPETALAYLQKSSVLAAEKLVSKLDDQTKDLEAAKEILDRSGVIAKQNPNLLQYNIGEINYVWKKRG